MECGVERHRRRIVRLKGYDYSRPGAYYVTVCTHLRSCLLGEVAEDEMRLNDYGHIVRTCWSDLPSHHAHLRLDAFVIMPNHIHGVFVLVEDQGSNGTTVGAKRHGLPEIVRAFKTFSSRRINERRGTPGTRVWQRSYYERVVRSEHELNRIRQYIVDNPSRWSDDQYHPSRAAI
ncbi:MAG: transposase [Anaerolineae bacterium]|nr:transposase [Anaerolineae bacterium]NIO00094.1 transposase [Anaerolineae bacterium]NIQ80509.1 transposase [Anaerolineae bacterium]